MVEGSRLQGLGFRWLLAEHICSMLGPIKGEGVGGRKTNAALEGLWVAIFGLNVS